MISVVFFRPASGLEHGLSTLRSEEKREGDQQGPLLVAAGTANLGHDKGEAIRQAFLVVGCHHS